MGNKNHKVGINFQVTTKKAITNTLNLNEAIKAVLKTINSNSKVLSENKTAYDDAAKSVSKYNAETKKSNKITTSNTKVTKAAGSETKKFTKSNQNLGVTVGRVIQVFFAYRVALKAIDTVIGQLIPSYLEYEKALRNVQAITLENEDSFGRLDTTMRDITNNELLVYAKDSADALYNVASAGFRGAEALDVMNVTLMSSKANLVEANAMAKIITGTLNAYEGKVESATHVGNLFTKTIQRGVTTGAEMSQSFGMVVNTAAQFEVSLEELSAATALMTRNFVQTPQAITAMNQAIIQIASPSKEASDAAKELGLEFSASELKAKGFEGMMKDIAIATGGNKDSLTALFPNIKSLKALLVLTKNAGADYTNEVREMSNANTALADSFEKQKLAAAESFHEMDVAIDLLKISLGEGVTEVFLPFVEAITKMTKELNNLQPETQRMIGKMLLFGSVLAGIAATATLVFAGLSTIGLSVGAVTIAIGGLLTPLSQLALAFGAGILSLGAMNKELEKKKIVDDYAHAVENLDKVLKSSNKTLEESREKQVTLINQLKVLREAHDQDNASIETREALQKKIMELSGELKLAHEEEKQVILDKIEALTLEAKTYITKASMNGVDKKELEVLKGKNEALRELNAELEKLKKNEPDAIIKAGNFSNKEETEALSKSIALKVKSGEIDRTELKWLFAKQQITKGIYEEQLAYLDSIVDKEEDAVKKAKKLRKDASEDAKEKIKELENSNSIALTTGTAKLKTELAVRKKEFDEYIKELTAKGVDKGVIKSLKLVKKAEFKIEEEAIEKQEKKEKKARAKKNRQILNEAKDLVQEIARVNDESKVTAVKHSNEKEMREWKQKSEDLKAEIEITTDLETKKTLLLQLEAHYIKKSLLEAAFQKDLKDATKDDKDEKEDAINTAIDLYEKYKKEWADAKKKEASDDKKLLDDKTNDYKKMTATLSAGLSGIKDVFGVEAGTEISKTFDVLEDGLNGIAAGLSGDWGGMIKAGISMWGTMLSNAWDDFQTVFMGKESRFLKEHNKKLSEIMDKNQENKERLISLEIKDAKVKEATARILYEQSNTAENYYNWVSKRKTVIDEESKLIKEQEGDQQALNHSMEGYNAISKESFDKRTALMEDYYYSELDKIENWKDEEKNRIEQTIKNERTKKIMLFRLEKQYAEKLKKLAEKTAEDKRKIVSKLYSDIAKQIKATAKLETDEIDKIIDSVDKRVSELKEKLKEDISEYDTGYYKSFNEQKAKLTTELFDLMERGFVRGKDALEEFIKSEELLAKQQRIRGDLDDEGLAKKMEELAMMKAVYYEETAGNQTQRDLKNDYMELSNQAHEEAKRHHVEVMKMNAEQDIDPLEKYKKKQQGLKETEEEKLKKKMNALDSELKDSSGKWVTTITGAVGDILSGFTEKFADARREISSIDSSKNIRNVPISSARSKALEMTMMSMFGGGSSTPSKHLGSPARHSSGGGSSSLPSGMMGQFKSLSSGSPKVKEGLHYLHDGEMVLNRGQVFNMLKGGGVGTNIGNINIQTGSINANNPAEANRVVNDIVQKVGVALGKGINKTYSY